MCERRGGNVYTRGSNNEYPGCGAGWCCAPSSGSGADSGDSGTGGGDSGTPSPCNPACSVNATCVNGSCVCKSGYRGEKCNICANTPRSENNVVLSKDGKSINYNDVIMLFNYLEDDKENRVALVAGENKSLYHDSPCFTPDAALDTYAQWIVRSPLGDSFTGKFDGTFMLESQAYPGYFINFAGLKETGVSFLEKANFTADGKIFSSQKLQDDMRRKCIVINGDRNGYSCSFTARIFDADVRVQIASKNPDDAKKASTKQLTSGKNILIVSEASVMGLGDTHNSGLPNNLYPIRMPISGDGGEGVSRNLLYKTGCLTFGDVKDDCDGKDAAGIPYDANFPLSLYGTGSGSGNTCTADVSKIPPCVKRSVSKRLKYTIYLTNQTPNPRPAPPKPSFERGFIREITWKCDPSLFGGEILTFGDGTCDKMFVSKGGDISTGSPRKIVNVTNGQVILSPNATATVLDVHGGIRGVLDIKNCKKGDTCTVTLPSDEYKTEYTVGDAWIQYTQTSSDPKRTSMQSITNLEQMKSGATIKYEYNQNADGKFVYTPFKSFTSEGKPMNDDCPCGIETNPKNKTSILDYCRTGMRGLKIDEFFCCDLTKSSLCDQHIKDIINSGTGGIPVNTGSMSDRILPGPIS